MADKDFYTEQEVEQMKNCGISTKPLTHSSYRDVGTPDEPISKLKPYVPGANEKFVSPEQPTTQEHEKIMALSKELVKAISRVSELEKNHKYTFDEYSKERILAQGNQNQTKIENFGLVTMGLSGEVGEFNEIIKKHFFHGKDLNRIKALTELGDILWYLNWGAHILGSSLEEVAKMNCAKLRHRYPNGFDLNIAKELGEGK